jgi:hypothetical protein
VSATVAEVCAIALAIRSATRASSFAFVVTAFIVRVDCSSTVAVLSAPSASTSASLRTPASDAAISCSPVAVCSSARWTSFVFAATVVCERPSCSEAVAVSSTLVESAVTETRTCSAAAAWLSPFSTSLATDSSICVVRLTTCLSARTISSRRAEETSICLPLPLPLAMAELLTNNSRNVDE